MRDGPVTDSSGLSRRHWTALLLAPAAWSAFFVGAWVLPPAVCEHGGRGWLHAMVAATVALIGIGLVVALQAARQERGSWAGADTPRRFTAGVATLMSSLLVLGPFIAWAFVIVIGPCE